MAAYAGRKGLWRQGAIVRGALAVGGDAATIGGMEETTVSGRVRGLVARWSAGDAAARDELLNVVRGRLYELTHRMIRGFPKLRAMEETDDVVQNAAVRLWKSLEDVKPTNAREFFGLATTQIRRELLDLTRHHFGRQGERGLPEEASGGGGATDTYEPGNLAAWTEFHEAVGALPEEEREVVSLLWYQDLPQQEAAELLGVDKSTIKRRWRAARLKLASVLEP